MALGTLYDGAVVAVNSRGTGSVPAELSPAYCQATIPECSDRASRVTGVTFNSITVSWNVPVADGGAPIRGYQISWIAGDTSGMDKYKYNDNELYNYRLNPRNAI